MITQSTARAAFAAHLRAQAKTTKNPTTIAQYKKVAAMSDAEWPVYRNTLVAQRHQAQAVATIRRNAARIR